MKKKVEQQKNFTYAGIGASLFMLIIAGVSYRAYRQKQKDNLLITHQKNIIDESRKEILDSIYCAQRIQRSLLPSEKYLQRILGRS